MPGYKVREILVCRREHGLPLPNGFDKELFDRIYELDAWLWHTLYGKRDFCVGAFRMGVQRFHDRVSSILEVLKCFPSSSSGKGLIGFYSAVS
jgi:hypothetical protein